MSHGVNKKPRRANTKTAPKLLAAVLLLGLTVAVLSGTMFALLSDRPDNQNADANAGTVIVKLIEDAPFGETTPPTTPPDGGHLIDHKTFRAQSLGSLDTYIRAYLKPVVEAFDESRGENGEWILIPVSGNNIVLEVTALPAGPEDVNPGTWVGVDANGVLVGDLSKAKFFYYTKILGQNELTTDLRVQIVDIDMPEQFLNMEISYNLHVFIEGAQVKNSLWKKIFDIDALPF